MPETDRGEAQAFRIGVTGPPGAGKSTLIGQLVGALRQRGQRVGVLAVDPSSPITGGALLGDRVRLQHHAADDGVFIRSMATRGATGGVARATAEAIAVLDAAGFDVVIVETVGVGQGEIDVSRLVDLTVMLAVPGSGDEIQAMKAGLMEVADVFVVNKSDRSDAARTASDIEDALALRAGRGDGSRPPVLQVSALSGAGIPELVAVCDEVRTRPGFLAERRRRRQRDAATTGFGAVTWNLDHVGIATDNESASRGFFEGLLGLRGDVGEAVGTDGVRVAFLGQGESRVELVIPAGDESAVAGFIGKRGPGLHHIALRVANLARTLDFLHQQGVRLIDRTPRPGAHGRQVAFVHPSSTHGILVELVAADPER